MPIDDTLQRIEISDFSPGIYDPRGTILNAGGYDMQKGPNQSVPLGAAQLTHADGSSLGTFGCICTPGKALIGAPRKNLNARVRRLFSAIKASGTFPVGENRAAIVASWVESPIYQGAAATLVSPPTTPYFEDALFVAYSQFHDPASGTAYNNRMDVELFKLWTNPYTVYAWFAGGVNTATRQDGSSWATPFIHSMADFTSTAQILPTNTFVNVFSSINKLQAAPASTSVRMYGYPAPNPALDNNQAVHGTVATDFFRPELLFAHEARLCFTDEAVNGYSQFGANSQYSAQNDIGYYDIHDAYTNIPSYLQKPIEENQSGIRIAISINANELFIVKANNGGAVITGDLDFPTIRRLPGIHSPGNIYAKPVNTPIGVVYGGLGGVFLWSGAETSQLLSDQMDGCFWMPINGNPFVGALTAFSVSGFRFGHLGGFGFNHPWILAPSGFMYDTRFQSWWILDKPDPYTPMFMHGTAQSQILAVYPQIDGEGTTAGASSIVADRFDPEKQAQKYAWTSQPITPQLGRVVTVREVAILATSRSGSVSTLTVTVAGLAGTEAHTITLTNGARQPHIYRITFAIDCESIIVSFDTDGDSTSIGVDEPAAIIHYFNIGYQLTAMHPTL